eukprot:ANDGO_00896.mRNA.1 hypothetical protein SAMD00019534_048240
MSHGPRLSGTRVHTTAAVLTVPPAIAAQMDAVRRTHDRHYPRWMPHITLMYPFVPLAEFAEAERAMRCALDAESSGGGLRPFQMAIAPPFGMFHHHNNASTTVWLPPRTSIPGIMHTLYAALAAAFLPADTQPAVFTPHLTLGQWRSRHEAEAALSSLRHALGFPPDSLLSNNNNNNNSHPRWFEVTGVDMIARDGPNDPFKLIQHVPFCSTSSAHQGVHISGPQELGCSAARQ